MLLSLNDIVPLLHFLQRRMLLYYGVKKFDIPTTYWHYLDTTLLYSELNNQMRSCDS